MGKSIRKKQEEAAQKVEPYLKSLSQKSSYRKVKDRSANLESVKSWFSRFQIHFMGYENRDPVDFNVLSYNEHHLRTAIVKFVYVKYNVPGFLLKYFVDNVDSPNGPNSINTALKWFLEITSGKSLHKLNSTIFTKKEAHLYLHAPDHYNPFENITWVRCKVAGLNSRFTSILCKHRLSSSSHNSEKWKRFIEFLVRYQDRRIDDNRLLDIIDYVALQNSNFTFKGRTWESVCRVAVRWHRNSQWSSYAMPYMEWERKGIPLDWDYYDEKADVNWTFRELFNSEELLRESIEQHHCVVTYKNSCASGVRRIVSMSQGKKKALTLEIVGDCVVQCGGKYNRSPSVEEKVVLSKWLTKTRLRNKTIR